ncbi:hypothetical protein L6164_015533 [Bauhinia variegata]|uniref:Uncharacterized protein n=1 Tax=Bauhinia variegata TaxID=167791 RepID=A0ACB9NKJ9_BAUVA|nr:hypothetical protein L6164_015533 [Bauhinia variegata]
MFFLEDEAVQFPFPGPILETMLTADEIHELLSIIDESGDPGSPNSGSQESNRSVCSTDERRRRRMISNRESARRSRWRKKQHLENLTNKANRLKMENRQLKSQFGMIMHHHLLVSGQNEQLRSESISLLTRLSDLYRILGTMHSQ